MKRKLVLTFENNKLLHATVTDRGRRMHLPKIATSADAVKEVRDALASAMAAVAPDPALTTVSTNAINVATFLSEKVITSTESNKFVAAAEPEETTSITEAETETQDALRARSVCARPKSDKKESSMFGKSFSERTLEDSY